MMRPRALLGAGRDFSNWAKDRLAEAMAVEGDDYIKEITDAQPVATNSPKPGSLARKKGMGGRGNRVEYFVSLSLAKEIAMLERNE